MIQTILIVCIFFGKNILENEKQTSKTYENGMYLLKDVKQRW